MVWTRRARPGRVRPKPEEEASRRHGDRQASEPVAPTAVRHKQKLRFPPGLGDIGPNRSRRIALGREAFEGGWT